MRILSVYVEPLLFSPVLGKQSVPSRPPLVKTEPANHALRTRAFQLSRGESKVPNSVGKNRPAKRPSQRRYCHILLRKTGKQSSQKTPQPLKIMGFQALPILLSKMHFIRCPRGNANAGPIRKKRRNCPSSATPPGHMPFRNPAAAARSLGFGIGNRSQGPSPCLRGSLRRWGCRLRAGIGWVPFSACNGAKDGRHGGPGTPLGNESMETRRAQRTQSWGYQFFVPLLLFFVLRALCALCVSKSVPFGPSRFKDRPGRGVSAAKELAADMRLWRKGRENR